jgi:hypothetical protein
VCWLEVDEVETIDFADSQEKESNQWSLAEFLHIPGAVEGLHHRRMFFPIQEVGCFMSQYFLLCAQQR